MPNPPAVRGIVGKVLLLSAAVMLGVAGAVWRGWLPLDAIVRPYVALAFTVAGLLDGFLGLRFLGERGA